MALLMCRLGLRVIGFRRAHQIPHGDGGEKALQLAKSAHANASEYIPIAMILLLLLELAGGNFYLLNGLGCMFCLGRFVHARGILGDTLKIRRLGMRLTIISINILAVSNLIYFLFNRL